MSPVGDGKRPGPQTPFRLAILGDFSGRAARGELGSSEELRDRKPLKVDFQTLEEVLAELDVQLKLATPSGATVALRFAELDDFHPERIFKQVELFGELIDLRDRLANPAYGEKAAVKVRAWADAADDVSPPASPPGWGVDVPVVASLGDFISLPAVEAPQDLDTEEMLGRVVGPFAAAAQDRTPAALAEAVSASATALMREVLRHPDYQALESNWRGLEWLLRRVQKGGRVQAVLYDLSAAEFAADLAVAEDPKASAVYHLLVEQVERKPDSDPWSALVGHYLFQPIPPHAELLGRMAAIAAAAGAPFLTGVSARVLDDDFELDAEGKSAWETVRKSPDASFLGLAVPRFLLRPPFGAEYKPAESFAFEEHAGGIDGFLWGPAGLACAGLLAKSFMESGWGFKPGAALELADMPLAASRDEDDEPIAVVAERRFTSKKSLALTELGFMPLLSVRGRNCIQFACVRSLALEPGGLAGLWGKATGVSGPPASDAGPPGVGISMTGKRSSRGAAAAKAAAQEAEPDPEVDPELAAMLAGGDEEEAGGDDEPAEEETADEETTDEASAEEAEPEEALDPELAALLGGDDEAAAESGEGEAEEEEVDPELAALLGGDDAAENETEGDAADEEQVAGEEEIDPELAALFGDDAGQEETGANEEGEQDEEAQEEDAGMDPELAALLGEGGDQPEAEADEAEQEQAEAPEAEDELDPELAALLGGDEAEEEQGADDEADKPQAEEVDPDLAALLGEMEAEEPTDDETEADEDDEAEVGDEAEVEEPSPLDADEATASEEELATDMATVNEEPTAAGEEEVDQEAPAPAGDLPTADELQELVRAAQAATNYGTSGSPPTLDFAALLAPIPGDNPAGDGVPFAVNEELKQAREEVNPELFDEDDPTRPSEAVRADWPGIIDLAQKTLSETSKNLLVASRLLEALVMTEGFAGLRDGLHLLRLLVEICWDRLDPPVEEGDFEVRAAPFNWLDDPDRGARFPTTIRATPVMIAGPERYGWQHWQFAQDGREGLTADMIERAILKASREDCQRVVDDLNQSQEELRRLIEDLNGKLGHEAPGFTAVRPALEDSLRLATQILQKKGPAEAPEEGEPATEEGANGGTVMVAARSVNTREGAYRQLAEAAEALARLEPHSPVPFLVQRAVELGALPFPQLMRALIRDANVLAEMNRELGIKEASPPSEEEAPQEE